MITKEDLTKEEKLIHKIVTEVKLKPSTINNALGKISIARDLLNQDRPEKYFENQLSISLSRIRKYNTEVKKIYPYGVPKEISTKQKLQLSELKSYYKLDWSKKQVKILTFLLKGVKPYRILTKKQAKELGYNEFEKI